MATGALGNVRKHRFMRPDLLGARLRHHEREPGAINVLLRHLDRRNLRLCAAERQAHLAACHREVDLGQDIRVEQRAVPMQLAL